MALQYWEELFLHIFSPVRSSDWNLLTKIIIKIIISLKNSNPSYLAKEKDGDKKTNEQVEILNTGGGP